MKFAVLMNLFAFIGILFLLIKIFKSNDQWSLSRKTLIALIVGGFFGLGLHLVYPSVNNQAIIHNSINWINIIGNGYIRLLQMIVIPLVFISILSAITKLHDASSLGKISTLSLGTLLFTTMIAAIVGIFVTLLFHLNTHGFISGEQEMAQLAHINQNLIGVVSQLNVPDMLLSFIPTNPFNALASTSTTSIISVVLFAALVGFASLSILKKEKEKGVRILNGIEILQSIIMKLVKIIMQLTPYGVMALMAKMVANSNLAQFINLGGFLIASYIGIMIMFVVHGLLLSLTGVNPFSYIRKVWPVITFAFTSRSSAATIPLNIQTQMYRLGIPESIASFSASFGATIGQNGCAGLYPAMLAVMTAPSIGINPFDPLWMATLVGVVTISSIGVAGVGGGATFAALIVLPTMGLPITLVALLISIEPLIDMGRTALNVNGSMTAGTITSQLLKQTNKKILQET